MPLEYDLEEGYHEVEHYPDVDHLDGRGLWEGVGHADKPDGEDGPSTHTNIRTQDMQEHTYIVVKTNITVKLTVMIASKKKGLK